MKYTEEMIEKAYTEFNSDRDIVSCSSLEIVTYDFLKQNMKVTDFLQHRHIYLPQLCVCISSVFTEKDREKRWEQIKNYCEENEISFNKYKSIDFMINLKENKFKSGNLEDENYSLFIKNKDFSIINTEEIEKTIKGLARKIILAKHYNKKFGIIEYYSYYDIPLKLLKTYLCYVEEFKKEYPIVINFIEKLEITGQLEEIDVRTALIPKTNRHTINDLYINDEVFKRVVSQLLIAEYPIMTGTINYAYGLNSEGKLGTLYKRKIKEKCEKRN